ncbi:hypothetical protein VTO42DRAFT_8782 [Malbranchea cinnamomea]
MMRPPRIRLSLPSGSQAITTLNTLPPALKGFQELELCKCLVTKGVASGSTMDDLGGENFFFLVGFAAFMIPTMLLSPKALVKVE